MGSIDFEYALAIDPDNQEIPALLADARQLADKEALIKGRRRVVPIEEIGGEEQEETVDKVVGGLVGAVDKSLAIMEISDAKTAPAESAVCTNTEQNVEVKKVAQVEESVVSVSAEQTTKVKKATKEEQPQKAKPQTFKVPQMGHQFEHDFKLIGGDNQALYRYLKVFFLLTC